MSELKVGDKVLTIDPWFGNDLLTIVEFRRSETTVYAIFSDGGFFRTSALRLATLDEAKAEWREGSKEFDLFWYGQSLGEAIKAHELLGEELIEGGAAFVGDNYNIVQMVNDLGDDSHIENHISPLCKSKDV